MTGAPIEIKVDARDMQKLYADLRKAKSALSVEFRHGVTAAAKPVADAVKAGAPSARIARSIKVKPSFSAKSPSVAIIATAPNAAPINNKGRGGTFNHPVFGNRDNWASQAAHPFFDQGAHSAESRAQAAILKVMDDIAHKAGFR